MAPKLFEKYDNCNQNVGQIQYWYTKHLKIMWFLWHQKIQKVSDFGSKHLRSIDYIYAKCLKNIVIVKKKVQKYRIWNQTIRKVCFLAQTFNKYGISTQNTRKVSDFSSEHSKSIELIRILFEKYCICKQNIRK